MFSFTIPPTDAITFVSLSAADHPCLKHGPGGLSILLFGIDHLAEVCVKDGF